MSSIIEAVKQYISTWLTPHPNEDRARLVSFLEQCKLSAAERDLAIKGLEELEKTGKLSFEDYLLWKGLGFLYSGDQDLAAKYVGLSYRLSRDERRFELSTLLLGLHAPAMSDLLGQDKEFQAALDAYRQAPESRAALDRVSRCLQSRWDDLRYRLELCTYLCRRLGTASARQSSPSSRTKSRTRA